MTHPLQSEITRKKAVLAKVYGGERKAGMHNFSLKDGKRKHCKVFFMDAKMLMCSVITPDEVAQFKDYDER